MTDFGTKEIKYIEWNLNARGGINYEIPKKSIYKPARSIEKNLWC